MRPQRRWWRWVLLVLLAFLTAGFFGARYVVGHAAPILRTRVIQTLQARFKSKVDLAEIDVSLANGLAVHGSSLQIFGQTDPNPYEPGVQPLISVQEFRFQTGLLALFHSPMHVSTVFVKGMVLNIPPREDRQQIRSMGKGSAKIAIVVDQLLCEDSKLLINTRKPGKAPLTFEISNLKMHDVGPGNPIPFEATLVNPKPVGNIQSKGQFGPFDEATPRHTPISGEYSFTHADLGTLKGIGGMLSSNGKYHGILGKIEVEGATDTPDFRLNASGHPVNLHTDFHATVDGTDGDTYLEPVKARFLHSSFTAQGKVIRFETPHGHDIELNVVMDQARIEDLLDLGVKTDPPVMSGPVTLRTRMSLSPGPEDVANRLKLDGSFRISGGEFSNGKIQTRINDLSLRAQGKPQLVKEQGNQNVPSVLNGTFRLNAGVFTFSELQFAVPGVHSAVQGQYSLDGNVFDFRGKLRLDAELSQTMTGWKSVLLKPVDPLFRKNGAGTEIPFKVTGTRSEPHFGLDFGHKSSPKVSGATTSAKH
jgi:AsmA-like C-terminal region